MYVQGVPKKMGFTTCNSSSKSQFFLGHLVVSCNIRKTLQMVSCCKLLPIKICIFFSGEYF